MLLVISNKSDLATDFLVLRLHERRIPFKRLNTEDYLVRWATKFDVSANGVDVSIRCKGEQDLPLTNVTAAYIRQPRLPEIHVEESDRLFAEREAGEALKSLWRMLDDSVWLNVPHRILRASNKPEQLVAAQKHGLLVPDTCITTSFEDVQDFYWRCSGDLIAKAVKHGFLYEGHGARIAPTQKFGEACLNSWDDYAQIPMIYQRRIEKRYDIRTIVVGERVFSTAIDSQSHQETAIDWRVSDCHQISLTQSATELPTEVRRSCIELVAHFGLRYAAIDLAVDEDGKYYFFELNPNGQWAWVEQLGLHEIRDAIIDELQC